MSILHPLGIKPYISPSGNNNQTCATVGCNNPAKQGFTKCRRDCGKKICDTVGCNKPAKPGFTKCRKGCVKCSIPNCNKPAKRGFTKCRRNCGTKNNNHRCQSTYLHSNGCSNNAYPGSTVCSDCYNAYNNNSNNNNNNNNYTPTTPTICRTSACRSNAYPGHPKCHKDCGVICAINGCNNPTMGINYVKCSVGCGGTCKTPGCFNPRSPGYGKCSRKCY